MRPDWRSYRIAVVVTAIWAAVTLTFNTFAGTNYGFLNRNPPPPVCSMCWAPGRVYIFTATALILIVWALMTWPWERRGDAPSNVRSGSEHARSIVGSWRSTSVRIGRRTRARYRRPSAR